MKSAKVSQESLASLFDAIACLQTNQECAHFFHDLCTPNELQSMADRWLVARLLKQDYSYRDIARHTGVSLATISRVARYLAHGHAGYETAFARLEE